MPVFIDLNDAATGRLNSGINIFTQTMKVFPRVQFNVNGLCDINLNSSASPAATTQTVYVRSIWAGFSWVLPVHLVNGPESILYKLIEQHGVKLASHYKL